MIYQATDKWSDSNTLSHRSHKYYMKVGKGASARYFYSPQEYMAYRSGNKLAGRPVGVSNPLKKIQNPLAKIGRKVQANQTRRQGEQAMADLRKKQSERLNANAKRDAEIAAYNKKHFGKGDNQQGSAAERARAAKLRKASQARSGRDEAFRKAAASKANDSAKRAVAYQRNKTVAARKEADSKRKLQRAAEDAFTRDVTNKRTRTKVARAARVAGYKAKFAIGDAKRAAKKAYKTAKKAYNSKQGKTARKKAASTARKAYNRGRSFVKKLFGKR